MLRRKKKRDRFELFELRKKRLEQMTQGEGLYLFSNDKDVDLLLIKPIKINGKEVKRIPPKTSFEGDSYFFSMVRQGQLKFVKTIIDPKKEEKMLEEKLILDQPDKFTESGKTEHFVASPKKKKLNESQPEEEDKPKLINEDPMDGVVILG